MVAMPMGQQDMCQVDVHGFESGRNEFGPCWFTAGGVDDDSIMTGAHDVCVGSLKSELRRQPTQTLPRIRSKAFTFPGF